MTNYNDKTGSYECAADIRIVASGGKNLTVPVVYKSELLTDDKKKCHVTANFDFETAFANLMRDAVSKQATPTPIQQQASNPKDPCAHATTTAEINECAEKQFDEADKELNRAKE